MAEIDFLCLIFPVREGKYIYYSILVKIRLFLTVYFNNYTHKNNNICPQVNIRVNYFVFYTFLNRGVSEFQYITSVETTKTILQY